MSEKRFKVDYEVGVLDTKTNEIICDTVNADEVVALLNELSEENRELRHYKLYEDNKRLQTIIADLKEENEQLKQEIIVYKKAFQEQVQRCTL